MIHLKYTLDCLKVSKNLKGTLLSHPGLFHTYNPTPTYAKQP